MGVGIIQERVIPAPDASLFQDGSDKKIRRKNV
jgi:hypothetical protein